MTVDIDDEERKSCTVTAMQGQTTAGPKAGSGPHVGSARARLAEPKSRGFAASGPGRNITNPNPRNERRHGRASRPMSQINESRDVTDGSRRHWSQAPGRLIERKASEVVSDLVVGSKRRIS
ncbi:hypothetical protein C8R45DRAFT_1079897 [Mycena sanguinolenta]|nr:hypothetical protein C8R45DRAFT_1079897 [Mycena sanguinolenta]